MADTLKIFGRGFNYSQDGPGNRLVYHLQGCNMRCPWCSNPEGMDPKRESREIRTVTVDALEKEIRSCVPMFYDGGGVTFTGGEVTVQYDALSEVLTFLKNADISAVIETNATHPKLPALLPYLTLLIADLKHYDSEMLKEVTGVPGDVIFENLRTAAASETTLLIRIPLIHGFNDREGDMDGFVSFFRELTTDGFSVELLPYHEYGKDKWKKLGLEYKIDDGYVSGEYVSALQEALASAGIRVTHT